MSGITTDGSVSIYSQIYDQLNKNEETHVPFGLILEIRKKIDKPINGFMLYLVVKNDSWDKAIRIDGGQHLHQVELKAGNNSGFPTLDSKSKCLFTNVEWNTNNSNTILTFVKPKFLGIWITDFVLEITPAQRELFNNRELYAYWSDDDIFYKDNIDNKIKKDQIESGYVSFLG
ncbi:hypothetical protein ACTFIZ_010806 [Dictyostelium cf. discoideum]